MRMTLRALAALLGYPSTELKENICAVRAVFREEGLLRSAVQNSLEPLLASFGRSDLLDLQAGYTELFDRSRSLSLHLFEHIHGDSRERGQAMINLGRQYAERGFLLSTSELPDFVPVFLEYASCLPPNEAREMLQQPAHVFAALAERLDRQRSPYAGIFRALTAIAAVSPDPELVAELEERAPAENPAKIDEEWEEAPVTFLASAVHEMGGPTGAASKIRARNRQVSREGAR